MYRNVRDMSLKVLALAWSCLAVVTAAQPLAACSPEALAALHQAERLARAAEYEEVAEALTGGPAHRGCADLDTAAHSWSGWLAAIRAAATGGSAEALAPVQEALAALEPIGRSVASPREYGAALVRAAAAAAQDERDEMRVWLDHARDVAARMALTGAVAAWPLPLDAAEGELWLEVDDFVAARASFSRALAAGESPAGLRGLARARIGLGDTSGGCAAYRQASALASVEHPQGVIAREALVALAWCAP